MTVALVEFVDEFVTATNRRLADVSFFPDVLAGKFKGQSRRSRGFHDGIACLCQLFGPCPGDLRNSDCGTDHSYLEETDRIHFLARVFAVATKQSNAFANVLHHG